LEVLDELNLLGVEFISFREQINIDGPLGGPSRSPIGAVAELERNLIIESLARRYAARQAQGLPHRPQSARTGPCRNLARPLPRPEPSPDR
jgi:DNA invertase Pin-like site-specific DNA recombinase